MGRADDKEGESLLSEVEEEKDDEQEHSDVEELGGDPNKKYKCTQPGCNARFLRPSRLTWHLRKHNDERPYKCDQEGCDRAYTNSSHLKRHLNTTHKPVTKSYECKECGVEVGSLFSLKRHHKKIHDPQRLTCVECGAKFRKKHCYNEHLSMHAGVAMYKCDICDQNFTQLRLYKRHQKIHEQKEYSCTSPGCTEIFDKWTKLHKHLEIDHQFDCDQCGKKFIHKKLLTAHRASHDRAALVKPCPYDNCPRFYYYKRNLDEHILVAHLGREFTCDMCDKSFKFKANLVKHIKVVHEGIKISTSKRKNFRRRRKDAGDRKRSMATKLAGIELPDELEQQILRRKPRIDLEKSDETPAERAKRIANETTTLLTNKMDLEILNAVRKLVKISSDKPEEEINEISSKSSKNEKNEVPTVPENLDIFNEETDKTLAEPMDFEDDEQLSDTEEFVNEVDYNSDKDNETSMVSDDNVDTLENEEALLSSLLEDLEKEIPTIPEKNREYCEKNEAPSINNMKIGTPFINALGDEKPIVLAQYGEELLLPSDKNYQKISELLTSESVEVTVPLIYINNEK